MGCEWPEYLTGSERFLMEMKIASLKKKFSSLERVIKKLKKEIESLHISCG